MTTHSLTMKQQASWIVEHWKPYARELTTLTVLTVANAIVIMFFPYMMKRVIDGIQQSATQQQLFADVSLFFAISVAHFLIYRTLQTLRLKLNLSFEFGVRMRGFEALLNMGPSFFSKYRTGDLITRLNDDVNGKLAWFMCSCIFRLMEALSVIFAGLIMMLWLNPTLTIYTAGPLPILVALFVLTANQLHKKYAEVQESISELNDSLESCFSGIRVVKAFAAEKHQRELVEKSIERQRIAEIQAVRWQTLIDVLYGNVWQLAMIGVLLSGGAMAIAQQVSLGDLIAFETYVMMLAYPMFDVGQFLVKGRLSAVSIDRIDELEQETPEVKTYGDSEVCVHARRADSAVPDDLDIKKNSKPLMPVRFENLSYQFANSDKLSLENISFRAEPQQITAIAGEIGAGKSTLLQFVPRLIEPTSGELAIADRALADWDLISLRQQIGYVPQEAQLFSGTVLENIRFGRDWVTDEDVEMAISISQLQSEIEEWSEGLQTIVGPRGIRISGGQKQRVSLARAIAGRPSILLLDDCTASLDAETEDKVWEQLLTAIPNCTTMLVTHRPATLERASNIVLLQNGQIEEQGTFTELNTRNSHFHQLYVQWKLEENLG